MAELCGYGPCRCIVSPDELFCEDVCAMLGAGLVNQVKVSVDQSLELASGLVPRCACGHDGCGNSEVSGEIH